jgi:hypothetical protein
LSSPSSKALLDRVRLAIADVDDNERAGGAGTRSRPALEAAGPA